MKGKRLKDVLDEQPLAKTKWDVIFGKLKKLATAIEMFHGEKMNIDDLDYRWVDDRINYLESDGRKLSKQEMIDANKLWELYK